MAEAGTPREPRRVLVAIFQRGRGRRLERRSSRTARRPTTTRGRRSPFRVPARATTRRSTSTASSACILRSRRSSRSSRTAPPPSSTRPAAPTRRARTSTRRTSWSRARRAIKSTADGFLSRALAAEKTRRSPLRCARWRSRPGAAADPRRHPPARSSMTNLAEFGIRAGQLPAARRRTPSSPCTADAVAGHAPGARRRSRSRPCESCARPIPRRSRRPTAPIPAQPARQLAQADRAAHQGGRRAGDRLHRRRRLGHARRRRRRNGQLANRLRDFGQAIAAFAKDLGSRMADVTLVTMSEFGRTVKENGNRGTDHGHANVMLLARRRRQGRQGLRPVAGPRRLAPLREPRPRRHDRLSRRLRRDPVRADGRVATLAAVFPGYDCAESRRLGVIG